VLEKYAETKKNRNSFVGSFLIVFGLAMLTMKIFFILFCVGFSLFLNKIIIVKDFMLMYADYVIMITIA
jgi:hypothetical protein